MSYAIPLLAGAAAVFYYAAADQEMMEEEIAEIDMSRGGRRFEAFKNRNFSQEQTMGRFKSARPGTDERGAPCWFVNYTGFSETIQYHSPYEQLA